ncbi:hypothetical protein KM427_25225 [Nocardioides sp. LMS-CY]|uniref:Uncharacterized protein n=1 Tax=Nocardioides soli TaxID=1036020 RepID=A0A7W4Z433_9ACTN|nr:MULTISPECIES: hypothetical protein [Nocardioides]MBB3045708.1 hypothetical protein [Nocardioides soli]QWF22155.1 hypothetical protein KM427_25225 [Nocardioides sp. LMS-CY]
MSEVTQRSDQIACEEPRVSEIVQRLRGTVLVASFAVRRERVLEVRSRRREIPPLEMNISAVEMDPGRDAW